jgi:hypothetical protein
VPKIVHPLICDNPEIFKYWDFYKNAQLGLNPYKLTNGSNKKAYFLCECGHSHLRLICNMYKRGVPICSFLCSLGYKMPYLLIYGIMQKTMFLHIY